MKTLSKITLLVIALCLLIAADAPPQLPSSHWGTVAIFGRNVAAGTVVSAWVDGKQLASTRSLIWQGMSVYALDVPAGYEGAVIRFKVGLYWANQVGIWHSGTNVSLNLNGAWRPYGK